MQMSTDEECLAAARLAAENPGASKSALARRLFPDIRDEAGRARFRRLLLEADRRGLTTGGGEPPMPPRYGSPQGPPAPPEMLADYVVKIGQAQTAPAFGERDFLGLGKPAPLTPPKGVDDIEDVYSPPFVNPIEYGGSVYQRFQDKSDKKLAERREKPHDLVIRRITTDSPILLTNLSDAHLGNEFTDHGRALEDIRLVRDTPGAFAVFGGDGTDNFIKHASAMISSTSTPAQEYAALEYYLSEGGKKLIAGVSGNHNFWTKGFAGVDYLTSVFGRLGIAYAPHRVRLVLHVNAIEYRIELRHNYRFKSALNLSNGLQRMYDFTDWQWDIGLLGHTHDGPFCVPFERHGSTRWGGLAGSYKVFCDHGEQWGFNNAIPSSPAFILYPDRHEIVGFKDLRIAIAYLGAIRSART